MNRTKCLNAFHRAYVKRMKLSARRRSKQPPMSPEEFMAQAKRLRHASLREQSAT